VSSASANTSIPVKPSSCRGSASASQAARSPANHASSRTASLGGQLSSARPLVAIPSLIRSRPVAIATDQGPCSSGASAAVRVFGGTCTPIAAPAAGASALPSTCAAVTGRFPVPIQRASVTARSPLDFAGIGNHPTLKLLEQHGTATAEILSAEIGEGTTEGERIRCRPVLGCLNTPGRLLEPRRR